MDEIRVDVKGLAEIERKMRLLPEKFVNRGLRRALRRGANIVRDAARENAKRIDDPETRERIWKNIAVQGGGRRRERQAGGPMMRVGVRGGARPLKRGTETGLSGGNTTHWRFQELGTSEAPAQPFMRPALASNTGRAADAIVAAATVELDKEIQQLG